MLCQIIISLLYILLTSDYCVVYQIGICVQYILLLLYYSVYQININLLYIVLMSDYCIVYDIDISILFLVLLLYYSVISD